MKQIKRSEILDLWLKYHNTTTEEVIKNYPREILESPEWFKLFPCNQQQEEQWIKETRELLNKKYKMSKKMISNFWWELYINCAPYVENLK